MPKLAPPLIVRLPNWIGDVVMALPALERIHARSKVQAAPILLGKPWAAALLAGTGWHTETVEPTARARISQLRALRRMHGVRDLLLMTNSFSSAFEARIGGLRPIGFAHDGRGALLHRRLDRSAIRSRAGGDSERAANDIAGGVPTATDAPGYSPHNINGHDGDRQPPAIETLRYDALAESITGEKVPADAAPRLPVSADARRHMHARLGERHIDPARCIVLAPFAAGDLKLPDGRRVSKQWPGFAALAARLTGADGLGRDIVIAPGPDEVAQANAAFPGAQVLENVALDQYAALMQDAAMVVANDTGPGHVAAAVGARLLSVLGPTDPFVHGVRGPRVQILRDEAAPDGWPSVDAVHDCIRAVLRAG